jgi:hypothetical protein
MFRNCDVCGEIAPKTMRCTKCHNGDYCSSVCFKKAWPEHRKICVKPSSFHFWPNKSSVFPRLAFRFARAVNDYLLKKET